MNYVDVCFIVCVRSWPGTAQTQEKNGLLLGCFSEVDGGIEVKKAGCDEYENTAFVFLTFFFLFSFFPSFFLLLLFLFFFLFAPVTKEEAKEGKRGEQERGQETTE